MSDTDIGIYSIADTEKAATYITIESVLDTYYQFQNEHPSIVNKMKVAPDTFKKLNKYFEDEQAEKEKQGIKSLPPEQVWFSQLHGMTVVVDPDMKPGTWKFVDRSES